MFLPNVCHQRLKKALRDTRGVSLIVTLGLTMVLLLIAAGISMLVVNFMRVTHQVEYAAKAYFAAESGVEMGLYDLSAYKDGYEVDPAKNVCVDAISVSDPPALSVCDPTHPYRVTGLTAARAHGFWRLFSRTIKKTSDANYMIPNPFFAGDKDGALDDDEWGWFTKKQPISLSLTKDEQPNENDPANRFEYLPAGAEEKIILAIDPDETWDPDSDASGNEKESVATWTLSAVDGEGNDYTLQGVIREDDFSSNCDSSITDGTNCFILDFQNGPSSGSIDSNDGHPLAGEDINKNIGEAAGDIPPVTCPGTSNCVNAFNRVSGIPEDFNFNTIRDFLDDMSAANSNSDAAKHWHDARLSINLIGTLAETSDVPSNSLRYKVMSDAEISDEYTYIVSEGFAGTVKQTIEMRFRRQATIPIFSYAIFQ